MTNQKLTLAVAVMLTALSGCSVSDLQKSYLMQQSPGEGAIPAYELRLRMNEYGHRFSAIVEETADHIMHKTKDPDVRQHALLWKMYSIPAAQKSVFINDPMAAFLDTWILSRQMTFFFENGKGKTLFSGQQVSAVVACKRLEQELFTITEKFAPAPETVSLMNGWVNNNPIESLFFIRRSAMEDLASILGTEKSSFGSSVINLSQGFNDINTRLTVLSEFLPKQGRWQAEYLMAELFANEKVEMSYDTYLATMEKLNSFLQLKPDELMKQLQDGTLQAIDLQRLETLAELKKEREAVTTAFTTERLAFLEALTKERETAMQDADAMTYKLVDYSLQRTHEVMNSLFKKMLMLAGIAGGVLLLSLAIWKWNSRRGSA